MDAKFTTRSQEALGDAIQQASAAGNPQLEPAHVLNALLQQEGGVAKFSARQGEAMGRPGVARVCVGCDGDAPREVRVSGDAVLVFTASIDI